MLNTLTPVASTTELTAINIFQENNQSNNTDPTIIENELLITKLVTLFAVLFSSFICSLLPIVFARVDYFKRKFKEKNILLVLDQCNGLAGGVLLSGGLLHLLPDAIDSIQDGLTNLLGKKHGLTNYPLASLLLCLTVLFLYSSEFVFMAILGSLQKERKEKNGSHHSVNHGFGQPAENCNETTVLLKKEHHHHNEKHHEHHHHDHEEHGNCGHVEITNLIFERNIKQGIPFLLTSIILWIALSLHSIFIGLGFGAQSDVNKMWGIFAAIVSHQLIEAFSLGSIVNKGCKKISLAVALLFLYSIAVPIGIAIGMIVSHYANSEDHGQQQKDSPGLLVTEGVFLALAAGAFVYVALLEIAIHQPKNKYLKLTRLGLMLLGFSAMSVLAIWA
ncbi:hypothetical protein ABK040_000122 [Willaertia magna]